MPRQRDGCQRRIGPGIASGVATALPAVLDAAPAIPPPTSRSARILKNPPIKVVRMPRENAASPPRSNISRLIPAPEQKQNGMSSWSAFRQEVAHVHVKAARIMPTIRGISTATSAMIGMLAIPAPQRDHGEKGPSFSGQNRDSADITFIAKLPNQRRISPPLELLMAAIIASRSNRRSSAPKRCSTPALARWR